MIYQQKSNKCQINVYIWSTLFTVNTMSVAEFCCRVVELRIRSLKLTSLIRRVLTTSGREDKLSCPEPRDSDTIRENYGRQKLAQSLTRNRTNNVCMNLLSATCQGQDVCGPNTY